VWLDSDSCRRSPALEGDFPILRWFICEVPALESLVERETQDVLNLSNNISIEISTSSFRLVRGYSCMAVLLDEVY
jgi:hypothetical protein